MAVEQSNSLGNDNSVDLNKVREVNIKTEKLTQPEVNEYIKETRAFREDPLIGEISLEDALSTVASGAAGSAAVAAAPVTGGVSLGAIFGGLISWLNKRKTN